MSMEKTDPFLDARTRAQGDAPVAILAHAGSAGGQEDPPVSARILVVDRALEVGRGLLQDRQRFGSADAHVSRRHALFVARAAGRLLVQDLGSRNGVFVDGRQIEGPVSIEPGAVVTVGGEVFVHRAVSPAALEALAEDHRAPFGPGPTLCPEVALLRQRLRRLARTELDLLFTGETGVGKEVYAQAVHRASGRRGPFVAVNCAALPEHLVESELFGYARGAHSTAEQAKPGLVELAAGGTLFLDEIGEMPAAAQAKLLRFLQSRELVPLGATRARSIDLRVLAATHRAPAADEGEIGLRLDLLARLGPSAIRIPPLRDRLEDVGLLARQFLGGGARPFAPMAWASLFLRRWSGNVRALEKTMQFAAALADPDEPLEIEHLLAPPELTAPPPSAPQTRAARPTREDLVDLLTRHAGDVAQVARTLGRQRTLVWRWLRKEGVDPQGFRRPRPA